jgi:hypothetical protein
MTTPQQLEWWRRFTGLPLHEAEGAPTEPNATGEGTRVSSTPAPLNKDISSAKQLPRPMPPDCEILRGVVPGPDNFVLCKLHGHIVDLDTKQIVAETLKDFEAAHPEYRPLPMPMLPDCSPEHGHVPGPENHLLCHTHGHIVDIATRQVIAWSVKDYIRRYPRRPAAHAPAPPPAPAPPGPAPTEAPIPDPPGEPDEPVPGGDESRSMETRLREKANGVSMLIGEFESKQDKAREALRVYPNSLSGVNVPPCLNEALVAGGLLDKVEAPAHAFREAVGKYLANDDKKLLPEIAKASQGLLDAVKQFSDAMEKLYFCLLTPPPREPRPAPGDPDFSDWMDRQESADSFRRGLETQFNIELKPIQDLGIELAGDLDVLHHLTGLLMDA